MTHSCILRAGMPLAAALSLLGGCSHLTDVPAPSNLVDPSQVQTQSSAIAMYKGAVFKFVSNVGGGIYDQSFTAVSGVFADEYNALSNGTTAEIDTHTISPVELNGVSPYESLHSTRQTIDIAINGLMANGGTAPQSYLAELHALKGYIYVMLSELFCSGIPFSYLVNNGNLVYGQAESREDMLHHAIQQFDSAALYGADSAQIQQLAAVGKGRAYLDLDDFANAKAAVASVPTTFRYALIYDPVYSNYFGGATAGGWFAIATISMANLEGGHGLDYVSSNDPRVGTFLINGSPIPAKFQNPGDPVVLADGIEARLIEAESALHDHDVTSWANALNTLRATASAAPLPAIGADSTTGAPNDSVRIDVTFRERAFWMFGTGHRAGDMRRLVRTYGRRVEQVYPVGVQNLLYQPMTYAPSATLPAPQGEIDNNPNYHGCINHDA